ncbi:MULTISPECIES: hypothetical protein [Wolbachia]|nr:MULTISPECIES: hypothetical protein [Wolbachia]MDV6249418.1 hypothetical protein [Wolbachia endosymbiont of Zaprionus taronus]MCX3065559.1 hypothetical protein [Wolbachia endosymbiont of Drosophila pseudotakahashii]MCX3065711.1 hypothetical protein [Wolbachia endosymbiont of Drosophila pseudotakahashii]MDE5064869.1 hypothetical protein [Wolbachia endosymbiont of Drosophila tristis]MDE5066116.1 hypothetical protein [Wolbachia endosymbiont of Drosophila seguyi]
MVVNGVIRVPDTGFHPKGCHPSAQTLGWLCCITLYEMVIYGKFM